jgi:hypothetical protein
MTDNRLDKQFEALMRDAAETYRRPPEAPLDDMWASIEAQLPAEAPVVMLPMAPAARRFRYTSWIAAAATLVIGIGIGRATTSTGRTASLASAPAASTTVAAAARTDATPSTPYEVETSRYLGQTAALLIALPSELKTGKTDAQFIARAGDLLTTTRMLIDSPAATDPSMRNLLEDLELVLAQVVRLQNNNNRVEQDLITRALQQRDVLPRLRTAAADISAN